MSAPLLFSGCATALVTPFRPDGSVDTQAIQNLIHLQIQSGIDAIVLLGTTGEPSSLTMKERETVIQFGIDAAQNKIPIIVGTGSNDTHKAMEYAKQAKELGANGQLCVTPYYNKTSQSGLYKHFSTILDSCDLPMILYNVPSRTGMAISAKTAAKLSLHPNIAGIKEASGDLSFAADLFVQSMNQLTVYCGNDDLILPLMALGAKGAISVCSNIVPKQTRAITQACLCGQYTQAQQAQLMLIPLIRSLFVQVNPIPVKAALSMMGLIHDILRLPLVPLDDAFRIELYNLLHNENLIS